MKTRITIDRVEQMVDSSSYPMRYRVVDIFLDIAQKNTDSGSEVILWADDEIIGYRND